MQLLSDESKKKVLMNMIFYNIPTFMLGVVVGLLNNLDFRTSALVSAVTFLSAFIDLGKKIMEEEYVG